MLEFEIYFFKRSWVCFTWGELLNYFCDGALWKFFLLSEWINSFWEQTNLVRYHNSKKEKNTQVRTIQRYNKKQLVCSNWWVNNIGFLDHQLRTQFVSHIMNLLIKKWHIRQEPYAYYLYMLSWIPHSFF